MAEERIERKELIKSLGNTTKDSWLALAENLKLRVTAPNSGSSHCSVRMTGFPDNDVRGLVTTLTEDMSRQSKIKVFKRFLDCGFSEDDIWRGLGLLK
jgi:hypothetical protein